jgi:predicted esterase
MRRVHRGGAAGHCSASPTHRCKVTWLRRGGAAAAVAAAIAGASCAPHPGRLGPERAAGAGLVVLPPDYDPSRAYPVVELLPPTGNTSGTLLQIYLSRVGLGRLYREPVERQLAALWPYLFPAADPDRRGVVFVLSRGRGSTADYRSAGAWARTIARYEREVLADLRSLAATRRVDTTRLILAGFSLGGDLAWAITLRNPGVVRGAIVMASRASYRPAPSDARALAERGTRFFLTMGSRDASIRRRMARAAADDLDRLGIPHRFEVISGAGHEPAPPAVFAQALDFVLRR